MALGVELVPRTCWFSNVRKNVKRSEWDRLRKASYEKAGYICEICRGRGEKRSVECHEIWEYEDERHIQVLKGLISLCPRCHETKHIGLAGLHGRGEIAKNHLSKINNWTSEQTEQYLILIKKIWWERSKHEWELDLDWLENQAVHVKPKR
ncbi:MAG TPA: HNH endonuclease [Anaerolineae bacterium]|nr:HNH endonuclease [Anaerolineae bacterium]